MPPPPPRPPPDVRQKQRRRQEKPFGLINVLILALCASGGMMFYLNAQHYAATAIPPAASLNNNHERITALMEPQSSSSSRTRSTTKSTTSSSAKIRKNQEKESESKKAKATTKARRPLPPADGTFNSVPIYYKPHPPPPSTYSCVGENFRTDAWLFRSCSFRNLCFDLEQNDFVLISTPQEEALEKLLQETNANQTLTYMSSAGPQELSIGGLNPKWRKKPREYLKWWPRVIVQQQQQQQQQQQESQGYYELPPETVWVPFHSLAGYNAGHLFWDDFFPIFKLLTMFDLVTSPTDEHDDAETTDDSLYHRLLLTKIELKLWGTCDWNPKNTETCKRTFHKFLPAMGLTNASFSSTYNYRLLTENNQNKSNLICAPRGAAGLGMLTDHGDKMHGWDDKDMETTHNAGRGHVFYEFRNFMLRNLGLPANQQQPEGPPYNIIFSRFSSSTKGRVKGFGKQEKLISKSPTLGPLFNITAGRLSNFDLKEQARMASTAAIFVTVVGGGSMTATFLPRGSTLILYYEATGGRYQSKDTGKPARLDWDVLNHASSLRVHWLPIETMDDEKDMQVFEALITHEVRLLQEQQQTAAAANV